MEKDTFLKIFQENILCLLGIENHTTLKEKNRYGIIIFSFGSDSKDNIISGNRGESNDVAFYVYRSVSGNVISNNVAGPNNTVGFEFEESTGDELQGNNACGSDTGFRCTLSVVDDEGGNYGSNSNCAITALSCP